MMSGNPVELKSTEIVENMSLTFDLVCSEFQGQWTVKEKKTFFGNIVFINMWEEKSSDFIQVFLGPFITFSI